LESRPVGNIFSSAIRLSAGTVVASLIPILLQPVLRKLYSPEAFGALSVYISLVGIIVVVSSFKYELAIALPESSDDAKAVFHLSILIASLLNTTLFILICLFPDLIVRILNYPEKYRKWIYFIPLSALLFSIYNAFHFWMIRNRLFHFAGLSKICRRAGEGMGQVFLSTGRSFGLGLFIGDIIGQMVNVMSGLLFSIRNGLKIVIIDKPRIYKMAGRYKQFSIYNTIPTLLNTLTIALPVFLVNAKYGETNTGYLDLTRLLLFIPLVFVSEPLSQVLFQRFNDFKKNSKSLLNDFIRITSIMGLAGLFGIIITFLLSKSFILWLFGETWIKSANFANILVISILFRFVTEPFKLIFAAFEKIKLYSVWQTIYFITISGMFFINNLKIESFLSLFVILESACFLLLLSLIIVQIDRHEKLVNRLNRYEADQ